MKIYRPGQSMAMRLELLRFRGRQSILSVSEQPSEELPTGAWQ